MIIMRKVLSRILITAGIILISFALYQKVTTTYYQNKLVKEYDEYINSLIEKEIDVSNSEETEESINNIEETTDTEEPIDSVPPEEIDVIEIPPVKIEVKFDLAKYLEDKEISGLIEIPKIKVNAAILEGTDDRALKYTVGHYPSYGEIGQPGNYVLLGHRNYVYGHFFRNIDKLEVGDQINIKKDTDTYTYLVTESFVVAPEDVWVLEQTEDPTITLITCTPIGTYTDRLIVKGVLSNQT
jgi:sortase A